MSKSVEELFRDAPADATHYAAHCHYKLDGDTWMVHISGDEWDKSESMYNGQIKQSDIVARLQPKPWSGPEDGLPPVGIKVDYMGDHCTVVAHVIERGQKGAILQGNEDWFYGTEATIDPIKTPEQLAAEERERAVHDLASEIGGYYGDEHSDCSLGQKRLAAYLHDKGFKR